ncbi:MAG TPA: phage virion morphogenesis protein [Sphaerochaeta sp.]|nr:phage virion morphogenesis protein [Sphaerochaeta sp.]
MPLIEVTIEHKTTLLNIDPAAINKRIAEYMVSSTQRKINGGILPANAALTTAVKRNAKTLRDRGQLLASITSRSNETSAIVGTNHIGAKMHQYGGTIKAKKKWLFIPASSWTRTQQRRYGFGAGDVIRGLRKDNYNVWYQVNQNSGVVMAEKKLKRYKRDQKGKKIHNTIVLFILKKSVKIPARPFLFVDETDHKVIGRMLAETVTKDVKE